MSRKFINEHLNRWTKNTWMGTCTYEWNSTSPYAGVYARGPFMNHLSVEPYRPGETPPPGELANQSPRSPTPAKIPTLRPPKNRFQCWCIASGGSYGALFRFFVEFRFCWTWILGFLWNFRFVGLSTSEIGTSIPAKSSIFLFSAIIKCFSRYFVAFRLQTIFDN